MRQHIPLAGLVFQVVVLFPWHLEISKDLIELKNVIIDKKY